MELRFVAPEMKFDAVTAVNEGEPATLIIGLEVVPPVVMFKPA